MLKKEVLSGWEKEFNSSLIDSNVLSIALFSINKELIFANKAMTSLFTSKACDNLLNPTFDALLLLDNSRPLIFDGYLTIGNYSSINTSIYAQIFRKENKLLIIGGIIANQLIDQNKVVHKLNNDLNNLQRQLIKEKHVLNDTMNQLNKANDDLEKLNATKDRFISILGHDLRNPFNSLLGFSELLLTNIDNYDKQTIKKFAGIINDSSEQTFNLLNNLLEWSLVQRDKASFNPKIENLYNLIYETFILVNPLAEAKQIKIFMDIPQAIEADIDREMIKTIIRNLLSNAIKFTPENGEVHVYAKNEGKTVQIKISDNGLGMNEQTMESLFKIGVTKSQKGTNDEQGTGFGLLLIKEFVDIHKGTITVKSEIGKGSVFNINLPLLQNK